ncbi:MAG: 50S ribosomal protein L11 methyltransferase [Acetivibrionales bacterium]|jgi:ribosomal protein L11 methyltransferase
MKWIKVSIKTTGEAVDAVSDMLMSLGSGGVAIIDPSDFKKQGECPDSAECAGGNLDVMQGSGTMRDGEITVETYFSHERATGELDGLIQAKLDYISRFLDTGKRSVVYEEVDDEDWSVSWKKYYKPFNIAGNIVIKPGWEEYDAKPGETVVEMDPGMAFGTGLHETTKLCSRLLFDNVKKGDVVVDVGCGSGILSIIAAICGASRVFALDTDADAVRIARENFAINGMLDRIDVKQGELKDFGHKKADLIVANIIADVIIGLVPDVRRCLVKGGLMLASGIIRERKEEVVKAYRENGFDFISSDEMGEWVAMVFKCQGSL